MSFNSYNRGDWVRYTGACDAQVRWGSGNYDPRGVLVEGELYQITNVEVHRSHTKLMLDGFPNPSFNSVHFDPC